MEYKFQFLKAQYFKIIYCRPILLCIYVRGILSHFLTVVFNMTPLYE